MCPWCPMRDVDVSRLYRDPFQTDVNLNGIGDACESTWLCVVKHSAAAAKGLVDAECWCVFAVYLRGQPYPARQCAWWAARSQATSQTCARVLLRSGATLDGSPSLVPRAVCVRSLLSTLYSHNYSDARVTAVRCRDDGPTCDVCLCVLACELMLMLARTCALLGVCLTQWTTTRWLCP